MRRLGYWLTEKLKARGFLDGEINEAMNSAYDMGYDDGYNQCLTDQLDNLIESDIECSSTTQQKVQWFSKLQKLL